MIFHSSVPPPSSLSFYLLLTLSSFKAQFRCHLLYEDCFSLPDRYEHSFFLALLNYLYLKYLLLVWSFIYSHTSWVATIRPDTIVEPGILELVKPAMYLLQTSAVQYNFL